MESLVDAESEESSLGPYLARIVCVRACVRVRAPADTFAVFSRPESVLTASCGLPRTSLGSEPGPTAELELEPATADLTNVGGRRLDADGPSPRKSRRLTGTELLGTLDTSLLRGLDDTRGLPA